MSGKHLKNISSHSFSSSIRKTKNFDTIPAQPINPHPTQLNSLNTNNMPRICFNRQELNKILGVYGQMVANADWRDYAIDMLSDRALFSVFRKSSEHPLYTIAKIPKLAKKQGAYSVIAPTGLILKRGHELAIVLKIFDKKPRLMNF